MNSFVKGQQRDCSPRMRLGTFYVLVLHAMFWCNVWDLYMCSYSRLQHQSTGGSLTPAPSQRLRRVHRATTARLLSYYYVHVHIIPLHSWNGEHVNPLCIIQYTIPLVCYRDWIFMVLDKEIHHECIFPVQGVILACEFMDPKSSQYKEWPAYGPSGSTSDGPLTLCGLKGSDETSSPLALPAVAWREVHGFLRLHDFFMHSHGT